MGEPSPPTASDDRDLYCLQCGYNLRGLSGDPRRCPECGHLNPMGELELPAALITRQLRDMESSLSLSVAGVLVLLVGLVLLSCMVATPPRMLRESAEALEWLTWPCLAGAGLVPIGRLRFKRSCLGKPGWSPLYTRYVAHGSIMAGMIFIGIPAVILTMHDRRGNLTGAPKSDTLLGALLLLATFVIVAAIILFARWRVYPGLREEKDRLQREVAVALARERLRKDLVRPRRPFRGT